MTSYWVLQGNPKKWDHPEKLYSEPILGWSVSGVDQRVEVGDGVLIWMASAKPAMRGIYAAGKISGDPRVGYPLGWGDDKQRGSLTPFVALAIHWYLVHNPVVVEELRRSAFKNHRILQMPRRTAYECAQTEFESAVELMQEHGPTTLPVRPAASFGAWWDMV